jgi:hypothetical protein
MTQTGLDIGARANGRGEGGGGGSRLESSIDNKGKNVMNGVDSKPRY